MVVLAEDHESDVLAIPVRPGVPRVLLVTEIDVVAVALVGIVVVDGGNDFDPMIETLRRGGVPTFRTADRAIKMFETFCHHRLGRQG